MSIRTRRKPMRAVAVAAAAAVGASLLAISAPTGVGAAPVVTVETRIAGADRYATANAVALARATGVTTLRSVVIASGENFPDGLAASALAGALNAPMLLTQAAALPTSVLATLTTLRATNANLTNAVLVGGTSAISADIATQLTALGMTVTRIAGDTRYGTANAVAASVRANNTGTAIGTFGGYRTAFLANGNNFPDALAASAQAYKGKHPIFLTDGATLSDETKAAITAAGVQQIIILGGETAVSADVATAARAVTGVLATTRVGGADRYATATTLATTLATVDAGFKTRAMLVSGTNFPDALVAAQLAGGTNAYAIIPVASTLPAAVSAWLTANQSTLTTIRAIGGTEAVSADVVTAVQTGATTAPLTATIAAVDGANTATVTFSGAVGTSAADIASYAVRTAAGAVKTLVSATRNAGPTPAANTVATLTLTTGVFQPGDVISIVTGAISSAADTALKVAATSFTVVAATDAPTLTVVAYPTSNSASSGNAYTNRVWITVSSNVSVSSNPTAVATTLANSLRYTAPNVGQVPAPTAQTGRFSGCSPVAGTSTFSCSANGAAGELVAGGTVTVLAGAVSSSASTPVGSAATTATVTADTTVPSITAATFAQTATGGIAASRALVANNVTISAAGTLAGKAGNAAAVAVVLADANLGAESCVYVAATNTVTISAANASSGFAVRAACALSASAKDLFTVAAATGSTMSGATGGALSGGADLVTVTLTLSEAIGTWVAPTITIGGVNAGSVAFATPATQGTQLLAGTAVITGTTAGTALPGLSTVNLNVGTLDRVGNAAAVTPVAMTATPAS